MVVSWLFHSNLNLYKRRLLMLYIASSASMLYGINLFYDFRRWNFLGFVPIAFENNGCWETQIGQEMIKLTIIDLIVTIAAILVIDFIRAIVVRKCNWYFCCFELDSKNNHLDEKIFFPFWVKNISKLIRIYLIIFEAKLRYGSWLARVWGI